MRLQEKLWDSHRSQLWTVSLSHDLCPQNSSSLPATICSPDLTLPQTFVMWKLAQLSQSKQINFPVFTDFSWTCAYPRSNRCLKTPNKIQECANNHRLDWICRAPDAECCFSRKDIEQGTQRCPVEGIDLALAPRSIPLQTTDLVHFRSGRCGCGQSGRGRKSHLLHQFFLTFLCFPGPAAYLTVPVFPPLTFPPTPALPSMETDSLKLHVENSESPLLTPLILPLCPSFPKSPPQYKWVPKTLQWDVKKCIFNLRRKMIYELFHLNRETENWERQCGLFRDPYSGRSRQKSAHLGKFRDLPTNLSYTEYFPSKGLRWGQ